jgi:two-component system, OmpR family, response regulator
MVIAVVMEELPIPMAARVSRPVFLPVRLLAVGGGAAAVAADAGGTDERTFEMRILLVEDDKDLQRLLKKALSEAGYVVDAAVDGEEGHFLGDTEPYDAVVLDLGLPKMDGVTVLEKWRAAGKTMPVLILTARDRWSDKVAGFDAGADDYLAKPFYTEELLARLRALLRRAAGIATADIEIGKLRIDTRASRVTFDGNPVKLTSQEYRLLAYLAHHRGKVVSRTELVEHLYDQDFDRDSNTIEVFIGRLRKKLNAGMIQTVRGLGYSLEDPKLGGTAAEA